MAHRPGDGGPHVPIHAGSRMSTALVRPIPPILTGRRACLRARSQRLPAAPTRAPPTSLYSAASISSSCLSAAGRVTDGGMARRKKVSVVLLQKRSRTCITCCAVWISFVSRSLRMPSSGLSAL